MAFDTGALVVGGISLATIALNKIRWYVKRNGQVTWGCGCSDRPLNDDDEYEVKFGQLGQDVPVMYVKPKHHVERESSVEE